MGDCAEHTVFSILMKMYILGQFYWYNPFLRIKRNRLLLFERNLHITALKRKKMVMHYKMVQIHCLVKALNNGTVSRIYA